jgi:hypothetical protein
MAFVALLAPSLSAAEVVWFLSILVGLREMDGWWWFRVVGLGKEVDDLADGV